MADGDKKTIGIAANGRCPMVRARSRRPTPPAPEKKAGFPREGKAHPSSYLS